MKLNHLIRRSGIAILCVLFSSQAMAYKYWTDTCGANRKWPSGGFTFNANPTGFDGTYAFWRTSFQVALDRVNNSPANITVGVTVDNDTDVAVSNGESEIWWASSGSSAVGYNITNPCGNTVEGDIIFHNPVPYNANMGTKTNFWNYGGNGRTFETTAIHEVGHTIGLAHEDRYYNIMGTDYTHVHTTGNNALRSYLGEDATNGLVALYGSSNRQDLSLAAWRRTGSSGEYSSHGRTRLFNSSGTELSKTTAVSSCTNTQCEQRYTVNLGQQIRYELTLENNGSSSQTVNLSYYISTNADITTADTLISTDSVTVTRNTPDTVTRNITIPTNINPNTDYYLGAIIDSSNSVSEWDETNNTSYIHIRTGSGSSSSGGSSSGGSSSGGSSSGGSSSGGALSNGQTVTGLSASQGNRTATYYIDVPSGASNLSISISGGTGDADLYVKKDSVPTDSSYDCRPYDSGNNETCGAGGDALATSQGRFYINAKAYSTFSGVSLTASYTAGGSSSGGSSSGGSSSGGSSSGGSSSGGSSSGGSSSGGSSSGGLSNGQTVTGLSASQGNRTATYYIDVPSGASNLSISISGGTGDADLYVKKDSVPTDSSYDCRPYDSGNNETCGAGGDALATSQGRFYINAKAYSTFSGVSLTASYTAGGSSSGGSSSGGSSSGGSSSGGSSSGGSSGGGIANACASEGPHSGNSLTAGDTICVASGTSSNAIQYFYILVPANTSSMTIRTQHGSGNGNLYYNASTWATSSAYTQSSTGSGNTESITVSSPASGYRFISVVGQQSGMALQVDLN